MLKILGHRAIARLILFDIEFVACINFTKLYQGNNLDLDFSFTDEIGKMRVSLSQQRA